jgi:hypothetical protein
MNLQEANKRIKEAWIAGVISGTLTLIMIGVAMFGMNIFNLNIRSLVDVFLIYGLSFGIYRKSRTCAILMLVYFVISKGLMYIENPRMIGSGLIVAIGFGYCFYRGITGTFAYHKAKKVEAVVES